MADGDIASTFSIVPSITGTLQTTAVINAAVSILPSFTATMWNGHILSGTVQIVPAMAATVGVVYEIEGLDFSLPTVTLDLEGVFSELGELDPAFSPLEVILEGVVDELGELDIVLPEIVAEFDTVVAEVGDLDLALPKIQFLLTAVEEPVAEFDITLPALRFDFSGMISEQGVLDFTLPVLAIDLVVAGTYVNMVMNLRNQALTEFEEYPFNSMCRFGTQHLATDGGRIYDLDGGKYDDGVQVDWSFRTGFLDLERQTKKKLRQAWIGMKTDGQLVVTVVQPDGTEYVYAAEAFETTETGVRVKFGKGIRSKYLALDFASEGGSTLELDAIRLLLDQFELKR
jgi:hypothetical protein